ncbi:hypothetical protein G5714_002028 [Onychostoma macrolepis]|uniref:Ig-like domain-containing protein n=1 Tax=Onychostoma macrolepis TaxID=369639 RepID=A0A7J6DER5_9TELE|nr:hypothetical protein G5714_002028 [Onychostoma macrolepis]
MDIFSVFLFCILASAVSGNVITPDETKLFAEEGSNVTLSCSYSSADYLYWYRQYPRSAPEFLVLILDGTTSTKMSDVDPRLSVKLTKQEQKHVDLIISSAAVSDSALYYCSNETDKLSNEQQGTGNGEGTSFADTIKPLSSEKNAVEGENVTLSCNYSSSTGNVNSLQWYRQYVGAKPEFLLLVDEYSSKSEPDLRLYSKATKEIKRVDLEISLLLYQTLLCITVLWSPQ